MGNVEIYMQEGARMAYKIIQADKSTALENQINAFERDGFVLVQLVANGVHLVAVLHKEDNRPGA